MFFRVGIPISSFELTDRFSQNSKHVTLLEATLNTAFFLKFHTAGIDKSVNFT